MSLGKEIKPKIISFFELRGGEKGGGGLNVLSLASVAAGHSLVAAAGSVEAAGGVREGGGEEEPPYRSRTGCGKFVGGFFLINVRGLSVK